MKIALLIKKINIAGYEGVKRRLFTCVLSTDDRFPRVVICFESKKMYDEFC